jgi:methylated-DNA-protein-cysteine methyltransferase-like protein
MSSLQNKFDQAIWKVVSRIAIGRVKSYGEVAREAGYPRHARMVSRAMSRSPHSLPWHRVVKSDRTIAFQPGSEPYLKQQNLLLNEGVKIVEGKIIAETSDKDRALDEILWGPIGD